MAASTSKTEQVERSPLTAKGGRTRQRIIEAAAELIYRNGAAATTIQEVRQLAGVSSSQLYHYFTDKQALVRAVVEYQGQRMVASQAAAEIDSLQALGRWRDGIIATWEQANVIGGCPLGTLGTELAETDPVGRIAAAHEFDRWQRSMADGLSRIRARGQLRQDANTNDLATALLAALQGGLLLSHVTHSSDPLKQALDAILTRIETDKAA
jgi:TetR/AcrR family transcriptional regulator, transcriptional repressor for nem operon